MSKEFESMDEENTGEVPYTIFTLFILLVRIKGKVSDLRRAINPQRHADHPQTTVRVKPGISDFEKTLVILLAKVWLKKRAFTPDKHLTAMRMTRQLQRSRKFSESLAG